MKPYLVSTKHIRDTDLTPSFIEDMRFCEKYDIPIYNEHAGYHTENNLHRVDGKPFSSGQVHWMHDTHRWPVIRNHYQPNLFPEDLFIL